MIDQTTRKVEDADLEGLGQVDIDEVQHAMDSLIRPEVDANSLYTRWERQQWAVSDLDFTRDRTDWEMLPPSVRDVMQSTMTLFFIGEQAVTDTLSPILHAAPAEDERIFLATQVADEGRHTVFFQRFFAEVLGVRGGLHEALEHLRPSTRLGFRRIFDEQLTEATEAVRRDPSDADAWIRSVVTYHLMVEGYLALTGQRTLLRILRNVNLLPGFQAGFTAVARDESRHLGFGVLALRARLERDPSIEQIITGQVERLLEPAIHTIVGPDQRLPFDDPNEIPPPMRIGPLEVRDFAQTSLSKRLAAVGVAPAEVARLVALGNRLYDDAWARYEDIHSVRHPVRWYQEGRVA